MRDVVLYIATSLDGHIARPDGSVDWLFTAGDYGYDGFLASVDTLVMGRKTYDSVRAMGPWPYAGLSCYVCTRSQEGQPDAEVTFAPVPPPRLIRDLKSHGGKRIWLVGGAEIVESLLDEGLIDEIILSIHPVLLGDGIPLFPDTFPAMPLQLISHQVFPDGLVQLCYRRS